MLSRTQAVPGQSLKTRLGVYHSTTDEKGVAIRLSMCYSVLNVESGGVARVAPKRFQGFRGPGFYLSVS